MLGLMATTSKRQLGLENVRTLINTPVIYISWHENASYIVCIFRNQKIGMMASASRDGELIARAIKSFGNIPVRGSTSSKGFEAARTMIKMLRQGGMGFMTPDGPRGPAYYLQPGILKIAAMVNCPIIPYHVEAKRQWKIKSWDKHKIPKPFTKVIEKFGNPLYIDIKELNLDEESVRLKVEKSMMRNKQECLQSINSI